MLLDFRRRVVFFCPVIFILDYIGKKKKKVFFFLAYISVTIEFTALLVKSV